MSAETETSEPRRPDIDLSTVVEFGTTRIEFASRPAGLDEDNVECVGSVMLTVSTRTNTAGEPINEWRENARTMLDAQEARAVLDLLALSIKNIL